MLKAGLRLDVVQDLSADLHERPRLALAGYFALLRMTYRLACAVGWDGLAATVSLQLGGVARELLLQEHAIQYTFLVAHRTRTGWLGGV